jgi:hypothetical protein
MNQPGKSKDNLQKNNKPVKEQEDDSNDPLDLKRQGEGTAGTTIEINPERLRIVEEITELFGNEDIILAVKKFKADSEEKQIAVEFAKSHVQFLTQQIESDYKKGIIRTDVEIRDVVSNVNAMLMKKDEYLFSTMITYSPAHYRNIQKKVYAQAKKKEEEKKEKK